MAQRKETDAELELHVQTTTHATVFTCQFPDGSMFSKLTEGNIEEWPEEARNKLIREVSIEAHTAYMATKPKADFASLVKNALEKKKR